MAATVMLPGFAVVTGAASGMGQATARALVTAGVSGIALIDINAAGLEMTQSQLLAAALNLSSPPTVRTFVCDVSSPDTVENTYLAIHGEFGRIDYAIHCAGVIVFGPSLDISLSDFDIHHTINYRGVYLCQRSALTLMRTQSLNNEAYPTANIPIHRAQRGAIVNISSGLALTNTSGTSAYCASKAAVLALTKGDALDYAPDRIRINAVLPGVIDTPMTNSSPEVRKGMEEGPVQKTPLKRFGSPEEVADVIIFLCSTGASYVTGSGWLVDGGYCTSN